MKWVDAAVLQHFRGVRFHCICLTCCLRKAEDYDEYWLALPNTAPRALRITSRRLSHLFSIWTDVRVTPQLKRRWAGQQTCTCKEPGDRWAVHLWQDELNRCHRCWCTCGMPCQDVCHWLQNKLTTFLPMIIQLLLNRKQQSETEQQKILSEKAPRTCAFPRGLTSTGSNTQTMFP